MSASGVSDLSSSLSRAVEIIQANAARFGERFPQGFSRNLRYDGAANVEWTPGFWTGLLWLAYEHTRDNRYREAAEAHISSFEARLDRGGRDVETHDLGFLYTLSCVAAWKVTANRAARSIALRAADLLAARYFDGGRIVQAWGRLDDPVQRGRIIIDSAMNMPLLFWAGAETGNPRYRVIACHHLDQTSRYLVRAEGSTLHTYYVDPETGEGRYPRTHQGFSDESCWSRGQAWAIYGFSLAARHAGEERFLMAARSAADYFLGRLPADGVCYWDLIFDAADRQEKDTSAAAIAAAGLLELSGHLSRGDPDSERYRHAAARILAALSADHATRGSEADGILMHAVCHRPQGQGVDECCLWGDYFYTEALMRVCTAWLPRWWTDAAGTAALT